MFGSSQCDIHTSHITQESDSSTSSRTHARKDNDVGLTALEGINGTDFNKMFILVTKSVIERPFEQPRLLGVRCDDGNSAIGRKTSRHSAQFLVQMDS